MSSFPTDTTTDSRADPPVRIQRSAKRKKTVSAHWSQDTVVLQVPAGMSSREVKRWERELVGKLVARRQRDRASSNRRSSDAHLQDRARFLSEKYLDAGVQPTAITWSARQNARWGSATPATGVVRISNRLRTAPDWVLDSVIFHELCHLVHADHSSDFRALESRFPDMAKAQAFLDGAAWASGSEATAPEV